MKDLYVVSSYTKQDMDFKLDKKRKYRVSNWNEYNQNLIARGSLSLWLNEHVIDNWYEKTASAKSGFKKIYSDECIQCGLRLKAIYGLSLRAAQGFIESIVSMLKLKIKVPSYTTFCRRQRQLKAVLEQPHHPNEPIVIAVDSTGLKVFGEGEWKSRNYGQDYRRTWRKLHVGIDIETQQIQAMALSTNDFKDGELLEDILNQVEQTVTKVLADGAYESFENYKCVEVIKAEPVIPPRKDAKIRQHGNSKDKPIARDQVVRSIKKTTIKQWKVSMGYHKRSLVETTMYRFKTIFGSKLSSRNFNSQLSEVIEKCSILNIFTNLGMPDSEMV